MERYDSPDARRQVPRITAETHPIDPTTTTREHIHISMKYYGRTWLCFICDSHGDKYHLRSQECCDKYTKNI